MFAVVIDGVVFADGEKPGCDAVGIERGEGGGELDESVLHNVPSVFEVGGEGEGVAHERALVAIKQGGEGESGCAHAGGVGGRHGWGKRFLGVKRTFFNGRSVIAQKVGATVMNRDRREWSEWCCIGAPRGLDFG